MSFKFEKLEVWELSLEYSDMIYDIAEQLPAEEKYNLKSQMKRAVTSVSLNIAEGSTGQSDREQARFLGHSIRSVLETVACMHIISRREYMDDRALLRDSYELAQKLVKKLQAFRSKIAPDKPWIQEKETPYDPAGNPFQ